MIHFSSLSDEDLVNLLRLGDKTAYSEIYSRYKSLLQQHAYKKLGDFEEVQDVLQDLFSNLWIKREALPEMTNISGYLYTAMRNKIFNLIAHQQVKSNHLQSLQNFIEADNYTTDFNIREKEFSEMIDLEIDALPSKMREVFLLSRKANLSHKEISEQLNIAQETVSKQVTNALKILRIK